MMSRGEYRQVLFRELKQTHRGRQTPTVFRVRWVFESLLKVNESARRMNSRSQHGRATIKDDSRDRGDLAGRHLNFDFLFRTLFGSGDGALLTEATSVAPARSESCEAHEIRTIFPGKSASRS